MSSFKSVPVKYGIKISKSIFQALKSDEFKRSFEKQSKIVKTQTYTKAK